MEFEKIREAVVFALGRLFSVDRLLLENNSHERSITHRLAFHMEKWFELNCKEKWTSGENRIDCEYNRIGTEENRKKITPKYPPEDDEARENGKAVAVFPDIIIHLRGDENKSYLVIEVKKNAKKGSEDCKKDINKLIGYIDYLAYSHGLFINFETGKNSDLREMVWFSRKEDGIRSNEVSVEIIERIKSLDPDEKDKIEDIANSMDNDPVVLKES